MLVHQRVRHGDLIWSSMFPSSVEDLHIEKNAATPWFITRSDLHTMEQWGIRSDLGFIYLHLYCFLFFLVGHIQSYSKSFVCILGERGDFSRTSDLSNPKNDRNVFSYFFQHDIDDDFLPRFPNVLFIWGLLHWFCWGELHFWNIAGFLFLWQSFSLWKRWGKFNFAKYFQEKNPEPLVFAPFSKGIQEMDGGGPAERRRLPAGAFLYGNRPEFLAKLGPHGWWKRCKFDVWIHFLIPSGND